MGKKHVYTQEQYLNLWGDSKFGLSIRGFGPKCNREIELLAMGCVPLLTEDVDVNYYDPLIEGLHYFRVKTPEDAVEIMRKCTPERWSYMSNIGRKWYETKQYIKRFIRHN